MNATIIGLGLIGGSIALDLKKAGIVSRVTGIDLCSAHAEEAARLGLVDEVVQIEAIKDADVVIMAIPVSALVKLLPAVLDLVPSHTVVIDAGSTKSQICKAVANHTKRSQFVAAHPIAGTENSGPSAAFSGLFKNKTNIICERERSSPAALELALKVFDALGMNTIFMEPEEHDRHVAYVSHLSHVSSFLLGQTVLDIERDEKNIFDLAGSGFASTVRLAKSSPDMWAPIFEQNAEYLSQALLEYIMHLQKFQYYLMKRDAKELHKIMTEANRIREILNGIELKQPKPSTVK
ncbi:prephenate dehydrogenase [Chryseolinea sp. T2]|uniref:prephenate dehydrogenase n=1 Tax=Chryseolinea sp. T2 TaxID=3129255 RepID=UPI003076EA5D